MISHAHKFVFIHIPKTGGTSLEWMLRDQGIVRQGEPNFHSIYFKHISAVQMQIMLGEEYGEYFKFAMIRNPWDWLVSMYEFCRGFAYPFLYGTPYSLKVPRKQQRMSFAEWLPWFRATFQMQQVDILSDEDGKIIVDEIFRFEDLQQCPAAIGARLNLDLDQHLPKLKSSIRKPLSHYYHDVGVRNLVEELFADDVAKFGYGYPG